MPQPIKSEGKTLIQLSDETGIAYETLRWRWRNGYRGAKLTQPCNGKTIPVGQVFGRWRVLANGEPWISRSLTKCPTFLVQCECGTLRHVTRTSLRKGDSKSCGCIRGGRPVRAIAA